LGLPTTEVLGTTFRGADLEAQLAVATRRMAAALPAGTLTAAREAVTAAAVNVLHSYRRHCATASNPGQLILPEALKLLPLYTLALEKSPCLR
jgi:protein transport protein SEC24